MVKTTISSLATVANVRNIDGLQVRTVTTSSRSVGMVVLTRTLLEDDFMQMA